MRIAMVSEHASPLVASDGLGGVDAGGQNVAVRALALALADAGHEVVVHTRRTDPRTPRRVPMAAGVVVDHVDAGPAADLPKDELVDLMDAFSADLAGCWRAERPDVVHAHFWMSGLAALPAARALGVPIVQTFHALGSVKRRHQGADDTSPARRVAAESDLGASVAPGAGDVPRRGRRARRAGRACRAGDGRALRGRRGALHAGGRRRVDVRP